MLMNNSLSKSAKIILSMSKINRIFSRIRLNFKNFENINNKKCDPKMVFFNEKKEKRIRIIFDIEN